ncbi:MAG: enoyl-CoA hydratase-related protein [Rhizobiaceae bacterium]
MVNLQDVRPEPAIRVVREGHVATVVLDRPDKKNAVTHGMWRHLAGLFDGFGGDDDLRAVIVRGAGTDFCAGADIAEFEAVRRDAATARDYEAANDAAFAAIRNCPVPVIAAIAGVCYGGGFGIAAAADIRIATPGASFSVPAARLGLAYPVAAMADIVNAVGVQTAKYLTFSAGRIDVSDALRTGFIHEIVNDDALEGRAGALAATIAANAPLSVRASKASIRAAVTGARTDIDRAERLGKATFESGDYAEGRAAFAERRKPSFNGR